MPIPDFSGVPPWGTPDDTKDKVNELTQRLRNLLVSLDDFNFDHITAKSIKVDELSAISANLGHITAGLIESVQIFGSYIATANGTYPRAEMSNTNNLFGALADASNRVTVETTGPGGTPATNYYNADSPTLPRGSNYLTDISGNTYYTMFGAERIQITGAQIWLNGPVLINSYASITDGGLTLQDQLDLLQNQITALKNRYDVHLHAYSGTDSGGDTYGGNTGGPNN